MSSSKANTHAHNKLTYYAKVNFLISYNEQSVNNHITFILWMNEKIEYFGKILAKFYFFHTTDINFF